MFSVPARADADCWWCVQIGCMDTAHARFTSFVLRRACAQETDVTNTALDRQWLFALGFTSRAFKLIRWSTLWTLWMHVEPERDGKWRQKERMNYEACCGNYVETRVAKAIHEVCVESRHVSHNTGHKHKTHAWYVMSLTFLQQF